MYNSLFLLFVCFVQHFALNFYIVLICINEATPLQIKASPNSVF